LVAAVLHAAPPKAAPVLETSFLVIPNKPLPPGQDLPSPSDISAMVGKKPYEVRSVMRPSNRQDLKTIIVFDLDSTLPENRPCLLKQARDVWRVYRGRRDVEILVVSTELSDTHGIIGQWENYRAYEYFLPGAIAEDACSQPAPNRSEWKDKPPYKGTASTLAFRGLAATIEKERGPVAIIWVGRRFWWLYPWIHGTVMAPPETGGTFAEANYAVPGIDAAELWLPELTQSGVDVLPFVWLNGRSASSVGPKKSIEAASKIVSYLGGQVKICNRNVAAGVRKVVTSARNGWIIQIAGPLVSWEAFPFPFLHLTYEPDRAVLDVKRRFVRPDELPPSLVWAQTFCDRRVPSVALFDAAWLVGKPGCNGVPEGAKKWTMAALIPDAVGQQTTDLLTAAAFDPANSGPLPEELAGLNRPAPDSHPGLKTRLETRPVVAVPSHGAPGGEAPNAGQTSPKRRDAPPSGSNGLLEVCVDLPPTTATTGSYRVMVFDPDSKWSGVGILPLADVLAYQRHGATAGEK